MTREDTRKVLDRVCRLYITQAKKFSPTEKKMMLDTWQETFKHDSYDRVNDAISRYVGNGNIFMPTVTDIVRELTAVEKSQSGRVFTETDTLFAKLVKIADILANNKEHQSIIDPGGFRWSDKYQKKIYMHPEVLVSTTSYTQYDFMQLPKEIQEYVEDIEGLRRMWSEIESSRELARRRFEAALPGIKAEIAKREEQLIKENLERKRAM